VGRGTTTSSNCKVDSAQLDHNSVQLCPHAHAQYSCLLTKQVDIN